MNSKQVLDKVLTLLSLTKSEEVVLTYAKLADGTILESSTFDVGEAIDIVTEDGKTPAPDGTHELALKDAEGNDVIIKVVVKDGKIESREDIADATPAESAKPETEIETQLATEEAHPLPMTTDEDPRNTITDDSEDTEKDPLITMSYRISELEKVCAGLQEKMAALTPEEEKKAAEVKKEEEIKMEDVELPKLNGAPVEETATKFSAVSKTDKLKEVNSQNSFLSKLYN
jgi:hypothetical protein